jgi:hypothetical protein
VPVSTGPAESTGGSGGSGEENENVPVWPRLPNVAFEPDWVSQAKLRTPKFKLYMDVIGVVGSLGPNPNVAACAPVSSALLDPATNAAKLANRQRFLT